jgi:Phage gp6-like head-tail connector protein
MASLQIESPAAAEPVTLAEAKSHLRVTISDDDALIATYVQAAREGVEAFLGRSLVNKGYRQSLDAFPYFTDTMLSQLAYPPSYYSLPKYSTTLWNYSQMIKLFRAPLVKVSKISYLGTDGSWHDLLPTPFGPQFSTEYVVGDQFEDPNGNLQEVTAASESEAGGASLSGASFPSGWGSHVGDETTWGDLTLTCQGPAPAGDFVYDQDSEPPRIFPIPGQYWPAVLYYPNSVRIHFVAGYGPDDVNVPGLAKVGILHTVASWYENREAVSALSLKEVPGNVQDLLWGLRVLDFAPTRG